MDADHPTPESFQEYKSSIDSNGIREKIRIADVQGRFTSWRKAAFFLLIGVYAILPFVEIDNTPLLFIDILHRRFYLFGNTFNAQDFYLIFFLMSGVGFALFYLTAILGRVWCGWGCPQTVFLEGVFRPIERWIEGSKQAQLLLAHQAWGWKRVLKWMAKHALYLAASLVLSHIFLSYFFSMDQIREFVRQNPNQHWGVFLAMIAVTGLIYFNLAWFREQLCLIICPYGRIQSTLIDDDTMVIGYDAARGEPRGKLKEQGRGDCIDCMRCVHVCPTGIDIRHGLQLECIGCANCIDACNEIMRKVGRSEGLIRYDSLNGLNGKPRRIVRPRILLYTGLMIVGALVALSAFTYRRPFEANILRLQGSPYTVDNGLIRNQYMIHLVNKGEIRAMFQVLPEKNSGIHFILPVTEIEIDSLRDAKIPVFAEMEKSRYTGHTHITLTVINQTTQEEMITRAEFLGP